MEQFVNHKMEQFVNNKIEQVPQDLKEFVCGVCHKQFKKKYNLQVHQRLHTDERPYMCKFCKCTFRQLTHLKNHIYNVHQRSKKDGSNNKKTKNYLCLRCNRHYSSLWRVIAHNYTSHKNPTMPLFCLFCQKNFMLNSEALLKHCRIDHKKEMEQMNCIQDYVTWQNKNFTPYFDCNNCKEQLSTFESTLRHLVDEHQIDPSGMEEQNLQCLYECGRYFGTETALVNHFVNEHWLPGCTNCIMCEKPFHSPNAAKKHFRTFHCVPLRERLQTMGVNLEETEWDGNREKSLYCPYCGMGCANPAALEVHVRKHKQEKPFQCPNCEKAFTQSGNLNKHIKAIHQGLPTLKKSSAKTYRSCPECNLALTSPSAVDRHMRTHSGQKPYKCDSCEASFSQKGNLTAHSKICQGVVKTRATFSLSNTLAADTSQQIELLHFNLNPTNRSLLSPDVLHQDLASSSIFSKYKARNGVAPTTSETEGSEGGSNPYDPVGDNEQVDRMDYMNLEYLTEHYLSAAVGNVAEVCNASQAVQPNDHSQSVITRHFGGADGQVRGSSQVISGQEMDDCTSLTTIQDQSYLDPVNMGAFKVEDFFQDHTIDERFLNDCTSHIQDEMTTANDLLLVPVSCWWPSQSPTKAGNMVSNNNDVCGSTKTFSQTVIKNISGGEVKDGSSVGV